MNSHRTELLKEISAAVSNGARQWECRLCDRRPCDGGEVLYLWDPLVVDEVVVLFGVRQSALCALQPVLALAQVAAATALKSRSEESLGVFQSVKRG